MLEVTITHRIGNDLEAWLSEADARELLRRRWIGTGTEGLGSEPAAYPAGQGQRQISLFRDMAVRGAAVLASYPDVKGWPSHYRVVGVVPANAPILRLGRLICLKLSDARVFDGSTCFLGNVPPVNCTLQTCHKRTRGRLAHLAAGRLLDRHVLAMHPRDVEWITLNYLITAGICASIWSGGHAYPNVDHIGWSPAGREILAQTTVSIDPSVVASKAAKLRELASPERDLWLFAPREAQIGVTHEVRFQSIECAFEEIDRTNSGRSLIDRALQAMEVPAEHVPDV